MPAIPPTIHAEPEVSQWFDEVVLPFCEVWVADDQGETKALMVLDDEWINQLYVDQHRRGRV